MLLFLQKYLKTLAVVLICVSTVRIFLLTECVYFPRQAILNHDETTYVMKELEPDTPYSVHVTAIYPDESESEDLMGTERTCKAPKLAAVFRITSCKTAFYKLPARISQLDLHKRLES